MLPILKGIVTFFGAFVVFFFMTTMLSLFTEQPDWACAVFSMPGGGLAAWFIWKSTSGQTVGLGVSVFGGALLIGGISFTIGFVGPMVFVPDANQGPLLGLFITGPLGTLAGAIGGFIYWKKQKKRNGMSEKEASNDYPIHELFKKRWSPRAFSRKAIEPGKILSLLEAARWAPSCFNEQPWSFIVATQDDADEFERLLSCLVDKNQKWAQNAPLLLLSVAKLTFEHNGKPNRHALHDVGLAVENLILQGTALGLYTHQMAGFNVDKAREVYQIPPTHEPVTAMAIGYLGEPGDLPLEFQEGEGASRTRKGLSDFVYSGTWNSAASFLVQ